MAIRLSIAVGLAALALAACDSSNAPQPSRQNQLEPVALKPLPWADVPALPARLRVGESFTATARLSGGVDAHFAVTPSSDAIKAVHRVLGPGYFEFTITGEKVGNVDLVFTAEAPGYQTAEMKYEFLVWIPPPPPQETVSIERGPIPACEDQQRTAQELHLGAPSPVTHAWDTTPFRVWVDPDMSDAIREQVARFAWKLEYRLGYPVLDADVVADLADADIQVRFDQEVMDRGNRAWANAWLDPPAVEVSPVGADDDNNRRAMIEHEVSHLFGFGHHECARGGAGPGVPMSMTLSCLEPGERTGKGAVEEDIDNIGCVFPHPDYPR